MRKTNKQLIELGSKRLLESIPKPGYKVVCSSYDRAKALDETWYEHVIALNECVTNCRKRAAKMNFEFDLTLKHLVELWIKQKGRCALTGVDLCYKSGDLWNRNPRRASVDRIDSNGGYTKDNTRLLCHWANNALSTYSDKLFLDMCRQTVDKE